MTNNKWYLVCDTDKRIAMDYIQLPDVWKDVTNMAQLTDAQLAAIGTMSSYTNLALLSIDEARNVGIMADSIDFVLMMVAPEYMVWIRSMRDLILTATDSATGVDRFNNFDVVGQASITNYRQQLRDLTNQRLFNITWPSIPTELDFVRKVDVTSIARPSAEFLTMLNDPSPSKSIDEIKADQWLRIREKRDKVCMGGVKLNVDSVDYWFWTDPPSRIQYSIVDSKARRANVPLTTVLVNWKTMSGDFVPMTVELLYRVIDAGIDNEDAVFQIAEQHREALMASDDPLNYDYSTGWPVIYADTLQS